MNCQINDLKIVHINVRGFRANSHSLLQYLESQHFPDIVSVNETKLNPAIAINIQNYYCASRRDSVHGHHGSLILVKRGLTDVHELIALPDLFNEEVIGIRIKGKNGLPSLNVCTYYNPPGSHVNPDIFQHCSKLKGATIFTGDLNCKNTSWGSTRNDDQGEHLLQILNDNAFAVLNDGNMTRCDPIHGTEQVLDLILCNYAALGHFTQFMVGPDVGSDHYPLLASFRLKVSSTTYMRNWKKADWASYKSHLEDISLENPKTADDIDTQIAFLSKMIIEALDKVCPLKQKKISKCSNFTPEMLSIVKRKRRLRRQKCEATRNGDYDQAAALQTHVNRLNKELKKLQKQKIKVDLNRDCENLSREKDSSKFFKLFDRITNRPNHSGQRLSAVISMDDGTKATNNQEKAEMFARHLENCHKINDYKGFDSNWRSTVENYVNERPSVFKASKHSTYTTPEPGDDNSLLVPITLEEIVANVKLCKNKSAAGEDQINYQMIKRLPLNIYHQVTKIFNASLKLGYFSEHWKKASVIMLPKEGKDGRQVKNHRPISLLPCLGKVFERIIASRLSKFMESKNLFNPFQSGFRKGHMAPEQLLRLVEETSLGMKEKKITAALFLDAEAAFDKAWHDGIRFKLDNQLQLPQRLTRLISSFLTDRSLSVKVDDEVSRSVKMQAGTPQGSCLSPLLYLILVNDVPKEVTLTGSLSQFADDAAVWSQAYTFRGAIRRLQQSINMLEGWCRRWHIKLNAAKSNLLILHRLPEKMPEDLGILLFDDTVKPCHGTKFLGLHLDERLSFTTHMNEIVKKSKTRLNLLRMLARGGVENRTLLRLYKTYIRPIMEYGCLATTTMSEDTLSKFQTIQNEFLRICLNLPRYIRTTLLHEAAGLEMVKTRIMSLAKSHFEKIKKQDTIIDLCNRYKNTIPLNNYRSPLDNLSLHG